MLRVIFSVSPQAPFHPNIFGMRVRHGSVDPSNTPRTCRRRGDRCCCRCCCCCCRHNTINVTMSTNEHGTHENILDIPQKRALLDVQMCCSGTCS